MIEWAMLTLRVFNGRHWKTISLNSSEQSYAIFCFSIHYTQNINEIGQMFHPSSNRLAGFLEISALSISLAQSGGNQYKAGFLRIESSGNGGGEFGRKSARWREKKQSRWCAVRESYLVALEEPGEVSPTKLFGSRSQRLIIISGLISLQCGMSFYSTRILGLNGQNGTTVKILETYFIPKNRT